MERLRRTAAFRWLLGNVLWVALTKIVGMLAAAVVTIGASVAEGWPFPAVFVLTVGAMGLVVWGINGVVRTVDHLRSRPR